MDETKNAPLFSDETLAAIAPAPKPDHQGALEDANSHLAPPPKDVAFSPETQAALDAEEKEAKYGGMAGALKTGLQGAADAATFGLAGGIQDAFEPDAFKREDQRKARLEQREANPVANMVGQGVGMAASALIPGGGVVGAIEKGAARATEALLPKAIAIGAEAAAPTAMYKIGSQATKMAIENALFATGDEVAKTLAGDPPKSAEAFIGDVGLAAAVGGVFGAGLGAVNPLWKATAGKQMDGTLGAIQRKLGGREAVKGANEVTEGLAELGITADPAIIAGMSEDPVMRARFLELQQSQSKSGFAAKEMAHKMRGDLADTTVRELGFDPKAVPANLSEYRMGREAGDTLANEVHEMVGPISERYDQFYKKVEGAGLTPSMADKAPEIEAMSGKLASKIEKSTNALMKAQKRGDVEGAVEIAAKLEEHQQELRMLRQSSQAPGTVDRASERIMKLAQDEGWASSASSDIMKEVNRVIKELPDQKDLKSLTKYIEQVGHNTGSDVTNRPLMRAGSKMKAILREEEALAIESHLGEKAGQAAVDEFRAVQRDFAQHASKVDSLKEIVGQKYSSVSGYGKALKEMAKNDAETLLKRLGRDGDASALEFIQANFPRTADQVRKANMALLLEKAGNAATDGHSISLKKLTNAIRDLSPEMQEFMLPKGARDKLDLVSEMAEKLNNKDYNHSNTGRRVENLLKDFGGNLMGLISGLATGSAGIGLITREVGTHAGKELPDAARLALLKFLGSEGAPKGAGFKAMMEYIGAVQRGEAKTVNAVKNVFKAGVRVLPEAMQPSHRDIEKLDKQLESLQKNGPGNHVVASESAHDLSDYMPDHTAATIASVGSIANFLNSQRPVSPQANMLDTKLPMNAEQKAKWHNLLTIAQQPLTVLPKIASGRITGAEVLALKQMYPTTYSKLAKSLTEQMMTKVQKGESIPYSTRQGMSLFLGTPLDATLTPTGISSAQPMLAQPPEGMGPQPKGHKPPAASSLKGLMKAPASAMTADQARTARGQRLK